MKLFAIISFALIVLGANASNPSLNTSKTPDQTIPGNIRYSVTIHVTPGVIIPKMHFYVVLTDQNNRRVADAQQVEFGKWTYQFTEMGPVSGIRVAHLIETTADDAFMPYSCSPDIKSGTFRNGVTYMFNLYPTREIPE